jgi:hypothetical protein
VLLGVLDAALRDLRSGRRAVGGRRTEGVEPRAPPVYMCCRPTAFNLTRSVTTSIGVFMAMPLTPSSLVRPANSETKALGVHPEAEGRLFRLAKASGRFSMRLISSRSSPWDVQAPFVLGADDLVEADALGGGEGPQSFSACETSVLVQPHHRTGLAQLGEDRQRIEQVLVGVQVDVRTADPRSSSGWDQLTWSFAVRETGTANGPAAPNVRIVVHAIYPSAPPT